MPPRRTTPATAVAQKPRKAGNLCLGGHCKCQRNAAGSFRLPAKKAKREKFLQLCLGPKPWPEELCGERLAKEFRIAHAHFLEGDLTIDTKGGKITRRVSGTQALPVVPVKDMPAAPTAIPPVPLPRAAPEAAAPVAAGAGAGAGTARPARGERAAQAAADEAAEVVAALWETAFTGLEAAEADGSVPKGTTSMVRKQLKALNAADRANALLVHQLKDKVRLHEVAAQQRAVLGDLVAVRDLLFGQHAAYLGRLGDLVVRLGLADRPARGGRLVVVLGSNVPAHVRADIELDSSYEVGAHHIV